MNKKVREITKDAILLAILEVLIILLKYVFFFFDTTLLLLIGAVIGIRFFKCEYKRVVIFSVAVFLISFIYLDIINIIVYILPGIIVGNISHFLLKIIRNPLYYTSTILLYFVMHSIVELVYSKLILNLNIKDYFLSGMEFPGSMVSRLGMTGLIVIFLLYNLILALMESFIIRRTSLIIEYKKINKRA